MTERLATRKWKDTRRDFEANEYLKSKERNWMLAPNEFRYANYLLNVS